MCLKCRNQISGADHPAWRGGRSLNYYGYVRLAAPGHPKANGTGNYVLEHVLVMEQSLGRHLIKGENVHHKNGDRTDNKLENLELWNTSQPAGQRIEDKAKWAKEILALYPEFDDRYKR